MKQEILNSSALSLKKLIAVSALVLGCSLTILAQSSSAPQVEVKGIVGGVDFVAGDDQIIGHSLVGAAVRIYVTSRVGIEPEYVFMRHDANDHDHSFNLNLSYDFMDHTKKYVPYIIAGAGVTTNRSRFNGINFVTGAPSVIDRTGSSWTASAGAGMKIFLTKSLFVAPEVRLGHEPAFRGSVSIGYVISRKK